MSTKLSLSEATKNAKVAHPDLTWKQCKVLAKTWRAGMYGFKIDQVEPKKSSARIVHKKDPIEKLLRSHPWWKLRMEMIYEKRKDAAIRKDPTPTPAAPEPYNG